MFVGVDLAEHLTAGLLCPETPLRGRLHDALLTKRAVELRFRFVFVRNLGYCPPSSFEPQCAATLALG